jgi:large repetitive protein
MNNPRRIQRHLVKALAAGALLAAAALPMAIASVAGAAPTPPVLSTVSFTPHGATAASVGAGVSGTAAFTGTGFINDGGAVVATATCPAGTTLTFNSEAETSSTAATADFTSTGTAAASCTVTLSDNSDPGVPSNAIDFTVDAAPAITAALSPAEIWEATAPTTVTITGTGFGTGVAVAITADPTGQPLTATITSSTSTSIVLSVTPTNPDNSAAATPGDYDVTVTNTDGGSFTAASGFFVGSGLENLSPSAEAATGTVTVAILGSGFEYGATATLTSDGTTADAGACDTDITTGTIDTLTNAVVTTITSPTTGTITLPVNTIPGAPLTCDVSVQNTGAGNNNDITTLDAAFGLDGPSGVAPVITASNSTTPLVVGAAATTVTLTGSGFSSYSAVTTPPVALDDVTYSAANGAAGTSLTFNAAVASGAVEGPVIVTVGNGGNDTTFTPAISIAGPVITSQAPNLVEDAAFGTTVTLTGTGFTNTTTGTVAGNGTGLAGTVAYLSPTTMSLVVTTSPTGTAGATVTLQDVTSTGTVDSIAFPLTIDPAPAVQSPVTYATGAPLDVGVGATATTVYINGSGFLTGATVTAFTNGAGTADPDVTATVTSVNAAGTQITATVAVKTGDTNAAVGYTVTNTDGGSVKVAAFGYPIFIGAGPTITSVTPVTGDAGATTTFALAGTGFETGAVVTLSPANGTCGTPTISATTTLSVACTLGTAGVTPTYIVVTNPDGGSFTSTTAVLGAQAVAKPFHVGAVHGAATVGKTVTILISGTGFYGQPKVTATGFKFGVKKDSGKVLTIRVTTKATVKAGEHELTVKLANGKSGKAGFDVKK